MNDPHTTTPPDVWLIANDLMAYLRQRWPEAATACQIEALVLVAYGLKGPSYGVNALSHCIPTLQAK